MSSPRPEVVALRHFNQRYTKHVGVLEETFLGLDLPYNEARMLWEIGQGTTSVASLRERLGLDAGYTSRLVAALENAGMMTVAVDPADRRRRLLELTTTGHTYREEIDRRADGLATQLLDPLTQEQRDRIESALTQVDRLLAAATVAFKPAHPLDSEAVWALQAYFAELDRLFPGGFDPGDAIEADAPAYLDERGVFVLVRSEGGTLGCGAVTVLEPGLAEIRRMWLDPRLRGLGVGRRLLRHLQGLASDLGATRVRLYTNTALSDSIGLYRNDGFRDIPPYSTNDPYAQVWLEKTL